MNVVAPGGPLPEPFARSGSTRRGEVVDHVSLRNPISVPFQEKVFTAFEMFEPSAVIPFLKAKKRVDHTALDHPRCLSAGP